MPTLSRVSQAVLAATLAAAAPAFAASSATATAGAVSITLFDLNPADGLAPMPSLRARYTRPVFVTTAPVSLAADSSVAFWAKATVPTRLEARTSEERAVRIM